MSGSVTTVHHQQQVLKHFETHERLWNWQVKPGFEHAAVAQFVRQGVLDQTDLPDHQHIFDWHMCFYTLLRMPVVKAPKFPTRNKTSW